MGKSMQIEKQELIERINEIDDVKVLEKLRKILFTRTEKVSPPCAISAQELKEMIAVDATSSDGIPQDLFVKQAMQWR